MVTSALALAGFTICGCLIIYSKLPVKVRKFLQGHTLATDAITLLILYYLLGGTLVAMLAAAICGLVVSGFLYVTSRREQYPELFKLLELAKYYLEQMLKGLNDVVATLISQRQNTPGA